MSLSVALDPVTLAVLGSAFAGVAEEMGVVLVRAAYSSNIKERRDCSAAIFDGQGRTIAQAAHIPAHLGAMPESVAAVMERAPEPGDVFVLNDPDRGGSHLPDLTMVAPIVVDDEIVGFGATRAHHAEIGGMRPGSMPSDSREIYQEGLIIPPVRLVRRGAVEEDVLDMVLANVRTPKITRGDLRAQIAACEIAQAQIAELFGRYGAETVRAAFEGVLVYAERRTRELIRGLPDGVYSATSEVEGDGVTDDDIPIRVTVEVSDDTLVIDFTGTSPAVPGNVNTPFAVTRSACMFALRVLLPEDVPANFGVEAPVTVRVPEGTLGRARRPSAVVAGNVETSQRLADTVLLALGKATTVPAQGQGTMNNLIIGGSDWSYYETIGGGQGATLSGPGDSGVHVGMSNTLNTPIESLELEYPMRVERYELKGGAGGHGRHRGGDGIERSIRLLAPASVSLLTDRRRHVPLGVDGGEPGEPGQNLVNGRAVGAKASFDLEPGDVVTVRTPGGGGAGALEAGR
jgi:N-methylhydantoinase B